MPVSRRDHAHGSGVATDHRPDRFGGQGPEGARLSVVTALPDLETRISERARAADFGSWRGGVEAVGGCARPIHLDGFWRLEHADTGDTLAERSGRVLAPCGNRRASVCPACADRYAADAFHLVRAGLAGGKGVPEEVADRPRLFVTLTAPGFGAVHGQRRTPSGKRIPCGCGQFHHDADPRIGTAVDPHGYDYVGAALWNAHASELWHRFTIRVRRELCRAAGIRVRDFAQHARISYAKVAEYQRRGLVHFHAVIRLDGPDGAPDAPPGWAHPDLLAAAVAAAVSRTVVTRTVPTLAGDLAVDRFTWGDQADIRTIHPADGIERDGRAITDYALAGYIAKYATKGTSTSDLADRPIRSEADIDGLTVSAHHRALIRAAWDLGGLPGLAHLRRWAHMLGFRGHFLTKSAYYSTTFTAMRQARRAWRQAELCERYGVTTDDIVVVNDWCVTSFGYATDEERELAGAIYERIRYQRATKYHEQEYAA